MLYNDLVLDSIKTEVTGLIGDRFYLTTESQSFDRYPINHINVVTDDCEIEIGSIVYDEARKDCEIMEHLPLILRAFDFHNLDGYPLSIGKTSNRSYNVTLEGEPDHHSGEAELRQGWADSADQIVKVLTGLLCQ